MFFFAFFGSKREQRDRSKKFHVRSFSLLYNKRAREGNRRSPKGTISSHIRFFFLCCFVSTTSKKKNTGVCSKKKKKRGYQRKKLRKGRKDDPTTWNSPSRWHFFSLEGILFDPKRQKPLDDKVKWPRLPPQDTFFILFFSPSCWRFCDFLSWLVWAFS